MFKQMLDINENHVMKHIVNKLKNTRGDINQACYLCEWKYTLGAIKTKTHCFDAFN